MQHDEIKIYNIDINDLLAGFRIKRILSFMLILYDNKILKIAMQVNGNDEKDVFTFVCLSSEVFSEG